MNNSTNSTNSQKHTSAGNQPAGNPWAQSTKECLHELVSSEKGLQITEVRARLSRQGRNLLAEPRRRTALRMIRDQLTGFLNSLLMAAAVVAWIVGQNKDALMIVVVVSFNTILGFAQEFKAEKTLASLKKLVPQVARVRRSGNQMDIPASELVRGDIVLLEAGTRVPADCRLLQAESLEADESSLTGESAPAKKEHRAVFPQTQPLAERSNMLFMNTTITRGRAEAVVTSTGRLTEIGKVAQMIGSIELPRTPLQQQLDGLGKRLAFVSLIIVGIISALDYFRAVPPIRIAMNAISLAVASIPEGLPAVVTVTLALGILKMARKKAVVKRLAAVETLGSTNVICTDKTGTLTLNEMTMQHLWILHKFYSPGEIQNLSSTLQHQEFLVPLLLCNDAQENAHGFLGDPTEIALVKFGKAMNVDVAALRASLPRTAEIPFDSSQKFMATLHNTQLGQIVAVKGAPDVVLGKCSYLYNGTTAATPLGKTEANEVSTAIQI